jgi:anti-sigma B factor antagonist
LFAVDVTHRDGWAVVAVIGELELATAPRLRQEVVSLVGRGEHRIVLDLTGVDFIDSVGLGVVVGALKRTRGREGDLLVVAPDERIRSLFRLTRLDEIIELSDTVTDALADRAEPVAQPRPGASTDG